MAFISTYFPLIFNGVLYHIYNGPFGVICCPVSPHSVSVPVVTLVPRSNLSGAPTRSLRGSGCAVGVIGERWICRLCGSYSGSKEALFRHLDTYHVCLGLDSNYVFYCGWCGFLFRESKEYVDHYSMCKLHFVH